MDRLFTSHRLQSAKGASAVEKPPPETADIPAPGDNAQTGAETAERMPATPKPKEIGGPSGPEPTRYGDWERNGICYDF